MLMVFVLCGHLGEERVEDDSNGDGVMLGGIALPCWWPS